MGSDYSDQNKHSIANYSALKTAIANGEEQLVKELVANQSMQQLEKGYLIDLAKLGTNQTIIQLLEAIPVKE
jgi:hypothetical protein